MSVYPAVVGRHARLPHWASLPVVVALVGMSVTLLVTGMLNQAEQRRAEVLLDRQAATVAAAVTAETNRYIDTLTDLAAAIGSQTSLTAADYAAIMSGLNLQRLYGLSAVSLVLPSATAELPDPSEAWNTDQRANALVPDVRALPHRYIVLN